jgi:hypothetical protein
MEITLWMMEGGVWRDAGCAVIVKVPDDRGTLHVKLISLRPVLEGYFVFDCDSFQGYPWSKIPLVSGP